MAQESASSTEELAPVALTRKVLVEKFTIRYIKKNAIALYESNLTTQDEIDELGIYSGLLIPYLTQKENDAFHDRIMDVWYGIYHNSEEYIEQCEKEAEARSEAKKNGLVKPFKDMQLENDDDEMPF